MKKKLLIYLALAIAVPIAGEMKFYPVEANLRVSLGTPVFFFFLLWSRKLHPVLSGLVAGLSVVSFRIFLATLTVSTPIFKEAFIQHFPVFFYYLTFSLLFYFLKIKTLYDNPFFVGLLGVLAEIAASIIEIAFRSLFSQVPITINTFLLIGGIAFIRSFFVLGFFNIFVIREAKLAEEAQRKRNEQMLILISNLYVEMIQLKKTMKNSEHVTGECYSFYRELKENSYENYAKTALRIAGEMHEIKKDNQRIYAGLSKLMVKENLSDFMKIEEITEVILTCNDRYGQTLGKSITIKSDISESHQSYHTFTLLSIINNLISNAVEAIEYDGDILLVIYPSNNFTVIHVKDNGPGILERNKKLIFEPGFTTKFDIEGSASNGIGLSYVKNVIENLGGSITLDASEEDYKTIFTVKLPIDSLIQRG